MSLERQRGTVFTRLALALLVVLGALFSLPARADAATSGNVMINVVYDDSGSMVISGSSKMITRWSQARYAMEVFTAMMDEGDVLNVYPMSKSGSVGLTVQGSDANRVKRIHDMSGPYYNTPFSTVEGAIAGLRSADSSYERWLIVLTDGYFDDGATPMSTVQRALDAANAEGIRTVFLSIGDLDTPKANEDEGGYVVTASDGEDLLDAVASIANQVFSRQSLTSDYVSASGSTATLSLDIPVSQLIVFAQGEGVSVGSLSVNGQEVSASSVQQVSYADPKTVTNFDAVTDTSLRGCLVTFESGSDPFESGTYELEVSGARTVSYYYSPGVTVSCELVSEGTVVGEGDMLYPGTYEVEPCYLNPLTGEKVESALLPTDGMSLTVENGGDPMTFTGSRATVELESGDATFIASAQLPGNVFLTGERSYTIIPDSAALGVTFEDVPAYDIATLAENDQAILVRVTGPDGSPLSDEAWAVAELTVGEQAGIEWSAEKGDEPGTWLLTPRLTGEDAFWDDGCSLEPSVEVSYELEHDRGYGSGSQSVSVEVPLSELIKRNIGLIIAGIILLIILLGETVFKRRFRIPRGANPTCINKEDRKIQPHTGRRIAKDLWSVVIPYVAERATVYCSDSAEKCNFPNMRIKAVAKGRFRILNYAAMAQNNTIIDGVQYRSEEERERLKKKHFGFRGFQLDAVNRANRVIGTFVIN